MKKEFEVGNLVRCSFQCWKAMEKNKKECYFVVVKKPEKRQDLLTTYSVYSLTPQNMVKGCFDAETRIGWSSIAKKNLEEVPLP
jgi:hypothetical protein